MPEVTIGIDIGTTSTKAVAVDGDGNVLARARIPHDLIVTAPDRIEHDADAAWRRGPFDAIQALDLDGLDVRGIGVASMAPSLTAVDESGHPLTPGLIYGDARGRSELTASSPIAAGDIVGFLKWTTERCPGARGYWPAQAVALVALGGDPMIDLASAWSQLPLYDGAVWDPKLASECGAEVGQLPSVGDFGAIAGFTGEHVQGAQGAVLAAGFIDALGEQIVAGATEPGDVLVMGGATLVTWLVVPEIIEVPGLLCVPQLVPGRSSLGGPSNAGAIFGDWARRLIGETDEDTVLDPSAIPIWSPYVRGERTPFSDRDRRAVLHGLNLTHGAQAVRRATYEASGFVVRHVLDVAYAGGAVEPRRIVATGGSTRDAHWVQALADCTGLPVDVVASSEGGALGTAFVARVAAALESSITDATRWAKSSHRIDPDARWVGPCSERYARFRSLAG